MSEDEFWYTTPRFFQARINAKQRDDREAWVRARQIAYWVILPHVGKKTIRPDHLGRFAWEKIKSLHNPYGDKLPDEIAKFKAMTAGFREQIKKGTAKTLSPAEMAKLARK